MTFRGLSRNPGGWGRLCLPRQQVGQALEKGVSSPELRPLEADQYGKEYGSRLGTEGQDSFSRPSEGVLAMQNAWLLLC